MLRRLARVHPCYRQRFHKFRPGLARGMERAAAGPAGVIRHTRCGRPCLTAAADARLLSLAMTRLPAGSAHARHAPGCAESVMPAHCACCDSLPRIRRAVTCLCIPADD